MQTQSTCSQQHLNLTPARNHIHSKAPPQTNTMATPKFEGWLGKTPESVKGKMEWGSFEPKKWTEDDVDIEISHCGVCGSDLHVLRSGWGETPYRKLLSNLFFILSFFSLLFEEEKKGFSLRP